MHRSLFFWAQPVRMPAVAVETVGFLVFAASQIGTPGPANMALLATGARFGLAAAMPFVLGVTRGKQLIIWPIGFGVMSVLTSVPVLFVALKWLAVAYILWLAWRVIRLSLTPGAADKVPGFLAGLWVHPLNPKAWAMIVAGFTSFVDPGTPIIWASFVIATTLFCCQMLLHPLWCWGGARLARSLSGTIYEGYLMVTLALLTVASVGFVLVLGGRA